MGDRELTTVIRELERTICSNNKMCRREMNARLTGNWHLQMDAVQKSTNAAFTFRLLAFASTMRELSSAKVADMSHRAGHIYTTLYIIKNIRKMAFETRLGLSAPKLISAMQGKKSFDYFVFNLKKFTPDGGPRFSFNLSMSDVLIGDVQKNISSDNVLITFGQAVMDFNYDSRDEIIELDRAING